MRLFTVSTPNFLVGTLTMISSFLQENEHFAGEIVVATGKSFWALSSFEKKKLESFFGGRVRLIEFDERIILRFSKDAINRLGTPPRLWPAFMLFAAWQLDQDDTLFLDGDLLFVGETPELLESPQNPRAVWYPHGKVEGHPGYYNTGVLSLPKGFFSEEYLDSIFAAWRGRGSIDPRVGKADQALLNMSILETGVERLHPKYNTTKRMLPDRLEFHQLIKDIEQEDTRVIHYVNEKPWSRKTGLNEMGYCQVETLWIEKAIQFGVFEALGTSWQHYRLRESLSNR